MGKGSPEIPQGYPLQSLRPQVCLGFTQLCRGAQDLCNNVLSTYQCRNFTVLLMRVKNLSHQAFLKVSAQQDKIQVSTKVDDAKLRLLSAVDPYDF